MSTMDFSRARWRKSSFSGSQGGGNDNCVEVALVNAQWRKSSFSGGLGGGNDNCVEATLVDTVAGLRDSKNPDGPVLVVPATAWVALLNQSR
jgi:hypothetical protein